MFGINSEHHCKRITKKIMMMAMMREEKKKRKSEKFKERSKPNSDNDEAK